MEVINIFNHFVTNFQNDSYKRQSKHGTRNTGITIQYIYMSGENMFKGGGCVLYIFLLGFSLFFQWINETKLLSLNGKINGHTNSISSPRHLLGNKKVVE